MRLGVGVVTLLAACVAVGDGVEGGDTDAVESVPPESDSPAETDPAGETDPPVDTGPPLPDDPCVTRRPSVSVGTGLHTFEPLVDGQDLTMVRGTQGGWHLFVAVQASEVPQYVRLEVVVTDVDTGLVVTTGRAPLGLNLALVPPSLGTWSCQGFYAGFEARFDLRGLDDVEPGGDAPVDATYAWQELCGRRLRVEASLATPLGELLGRDEVVVVAAPDAVDAAVCPGG